MNGLCRTRTGDVRINRLLDRFALLEQADMLLQQIPVECVGMVKVDVLTFLYGHVTTVFVIRVLWDNHHFAFGKALNEFPNYRCFARAGTARNADDKHKEMFVSIRGAKVQINFHICK